MIYCISYSNLDQFGKLFASQFRLRHKCFVKRQGYDVPTYRGMEYDQYDTPATRYLVYASVHDEALAVSRLSPVRQHCMLRDLWPEMVADQSLLNSPHVWEGTRFCIQKELPAARRRQICKELVLAYLEFGLKNNIQSIIGIMPKLILRSVFARAGCAYKNLGPPRVIDDELIQAAGLSVNPLQLIKIRQRTGIYHNVLREERDYHAEAQLDRNFQCGAIPGPDIQYWEHHSQPRLLEKAG